MSIMLYTLDLMAKILLYISLTDEQINVGNAAPYLELATES